MSTSGGPEDWIDGIDPRMEVMSPKPCWMLRYSGTRTETLKEVASEWGRMNWIRSLIWLTGLICTVLALDKATSSTQKLS